MNRISTYDNIDNSNQIKNLPDSKQKSRIKETDWRQKKIYANIILNFFSNPKTRLVRSESEPSLNRNSNILDSPNSIHSKVPSTSHMDLI